MAEFISCEIALTSMSVDLTNEKSTLGQVMAWCHQAPSQYLSQCWLRSMSPYGITRPQWVTEVHSIKWKMRIFQSVSPLLIFLMMIHQSKASAGQRPISQTPLWTHTSNWNFMEILFALIFVLMIQSGHNFVHASTTQLSWHVKNYDLFEWLFFTFIFTRFGL